MWKDLLLSLEQLGTINRGLHEGRCGHDAQILTLVEELKYDICYCSRKSLINFDNNIASCYNCKLPNVSSLVVKKKGLHKNIIFVHAQTLKKAKYRLKTALGVSNEYYQHFITFPIYSSSQGATKSP
eukprot:2801565-Ditylum_brightwellii.AAC.1